MLNKSVTHYSHWLLSCLISHIMCNYYMVITLSVYNSQVCFQYGNEGNKIPLMYPSAFFPSYKSKAKAVICSHDRGQEIFIFWLKELHPTKLSGKKGWMDEYMVSQRSRPAPHSNLFNIVREMTLRSLVLNFSPDSKQKQWSHPNCDITIQHTVSDQRGID